jgi:hypothetical protein
MMSAKKSKDGKKTKIGNVKKKKGELSLNLSKDNEQVVKTALDNLRGADLNNPMNPQEISDAIRAIFAHLGWSDDAGVVK